MNLKSFKFVAVALIALLCFSLACAPSSSQAKSIESVSFQKKVNFKPVVRLDTRGNLQVAIVSVTREKHRENVANTHAAPNDAIIPQSTVFNISRIVNRLPEVFPAQTPARQIASYVSRNIQNTIKPPENRFNRARPNIVRLC